MSLIIRTTPTTPPPHLSPPPSPNTHITAATASCGTVHFVVEAPQLQFTDKLFAVPVVAQRAIHLAPFSDGDEKFYGDGNGGGFFGGAFFLASLRAPSSWTLSAFFSALNDEEFFVIEGSGVTGTPGV